MKSGPVTRAIAEVRAGRALTNPEAAMLRFVGLGPAGQPRLTIDHQSFDLDNAGDPWLRDRAEWYCTMLASALARMVSRAPQSAPGWRPIATVPDRRRVLLWWRPMGCEIIGMVEDGVLWHGDGSARQCEISNWQDLFPLWQPLPGGPEGAPWR